jgi:hypothetical protein
MLKYFTSVSCTIGIAGNNGFNITDENQYKLNNYKELIDTTFYIS